MTQIFQRFFKFEAITVSPVVWLGLGAVWILLIISAFGSLTTQSWSSGSKKAWGLAIVVVPIGGLFFYALASLLSADFSRFFERGFRRKK